MTPLHLVTTNGRPQHGVARKNPSRACTVAPPSPAPRQRMRTVAGRKAPERSEGRNNYYRARHTALAAEVALQPHTYLLNYRYTTETEACSPEERSDWCCASYYLPTAAIGVGDAFATPSSCDQVLAGLPKHPVCTKFTRSE